MSKVRKYYKGIELSFDSVANHFGVTVDDIAKCYTDIFINNTGDNHFITLCRVIKEYLHDWSDDTYDIATKYKEFTWFNIIQLATALHLHADDLNILIERGVSESDIIDEYYEFVDTDDFVKHIVSIADFLRKHPNVKENSLSKIVSSMNDIMRLEEYFKNILIYDYPRLYRGFVWGDITSLSNALCVEENQLKGYLDTHKNVRPEDLVDFCIDVASKIKERK